MRLRHFALLSVLPFSILLFSPLQAAGQELPWLAAWKLVQEANPQLAALSADAQSARAGISLEAARQKVHADLSAAASLPESSRAISTLGVAATYQVSLAGSEALLLEEARVRFRKAELLYRETSLELAKGVSDAYWTAAASSSRLKAGREGVRRREAFLSDAELRFAVGLSPRLDVMRAQSSLQEALAELERRKAEWDRSLALLREVAGGVVFSPVPLEMGPKADPPKVPPEGDFLPENHAGVQRARAEIERRLLLKRLAGRESSPTASLSLQRNLLTDGPASLAQDTWLGTVAVSVPLVDGGRSKAMLLAASEDVRSAAASLETAREAVRRNLAYAWADYRSSRAELDSARVLLELREKELELLRLRYREGLSSQLEFLDAETKFFEAQSGLIDARRRLSAAEWAISIGMGFLPGEEDHQ